MGVVCGNGNVHPRPSKRAKQAPKPDPLLPGGTLQHSLRYAIRRAQVTAYQQFMSSMSETGIRPASYALLVLMYENPGVTQSALGAALGIEKGNLTGLLLVLELEALGYIRRESMPADRRAYSLHLTSAGKVRTRLFMRQHEQYETALAVRLDPDERKTLLALLGKLLGP